MSPIASVLPACAAIIKIIAAKLNQENERGVNGARAGPRGRSDPGANRPQQERRKMRVIGGLGGLVARRRRRFGTADRRGARRRRRRWRGELGSRGLRLRAGI